jgi:hypothetical protein
MKKFCCFCNKKLGLLQKKILITKNPEEPELFRGYVCSTDCLKKLNKQIEKEFLEEMRSLKKTSKEFKCNSCGYLWTSKKKVGDPAFCPKCKGDSILKYSKTKDWREEFLKNKKNWVYSRLSGISANHINL